MRRLRRLTYTCILISALVLTACSGPQGPAMSAAQTSAAIQDLAQAGFDVVASDAWNQLPTGALGVLAGAGLPAATVAGNLPRGHYEYDETAEMWFLTSVSDDLVLDWEFEGSAYRLTIDWDATAPTVYVTDGSGDTYEVPRGAAATFTEDLTTVGASAFTSAWTVNQCDYDEPSAARLSGWVGDANARLTLDRLGFTLTDTAALDAVSVEAEATAEAGGDSLSGYIELSATGQLERDVDCVIVGFEPTTVSVAFGAEVVLLGARHSFDVQATASDPEYDGDQLTGFGLRGSLRLGGVVAVAFDGALNDANDNGIPGDELILTFAGDETMTLEEFILQQFGWGPLAVARLLMR